MCVIVWYILIYTQYSQKFLFAFPWQHPTKIYTFYLNKLIREIIKVIIFVKKIIDINKIKMKIKSSKSNFFFAFRKFEQ